MAVRSTYPNILAEGTSGIPVNQPATVPYPVVTAVNAGAVLVESAAPDPSFQVQYPSIPHATPTGTQLPGRLVMGYLDDKPATPLCPRGERGDHCAG